MTSETSNFIKWLYLVISLLIGFVFATFSAKFKKIGLFLTGAWLGYFISLFVYSLALYKIETNPPQVRFEIS